MHFWGTQRILNFVFLPLINGVYYTLEVEIIGHFAHKSEAMHKIKTVKMIEIVCLLLELEFKR